MESTNNKYRANDELDSIPTEEIIPEDALPDNPNDKTNRFVTVMLDDDFSSVDGGLSSELGSRKNQQDCARVDKEFMYQKNKLYLAVMCDGMGGMNGGEKASQLCVQKMFEAFYCVDVSGRVPSFFKFMIQNIDKMIYNLTDDNGTLLKSGSTLTSIIIEKDKLFWVSVGDSRIYIKRGNEFICLTTDHNYYMLLKKKVKQGLITQQQADSDPQKESLVSYMGKGGIDYMDINPYPFQLQNGDTILLCSDGLYRALNEYEIKNILDKNLNADKAAHELTRSAIKKNRPHQDNTTAVVVKYLC